MLPTRFTTYKRFRLSRTALTLFALATGYGFASGSAHAELKVCNKTESLVGVAVGYQVKKEWITEGWWRIPANVCTTIIDGDLNSRYFYLHAENSDTGGRWRGPIFMCTSNKEFKIQGLKDCFPRGFERTGFFEIDTGEQNSWQVRLTEANQTKKDDPAK